ncbi:MAG: tetratricopeptide repeat protein, partial [Ignavibacteria bacterium]|nr:tetratricopeptide repeat protein [Ignavibacteria bacterium]
SLGIFTRAVEDYKKALSIYRKDVHTLYNLANAYEQLEMYREAIETFSKAISIDDSNYESYFGRGNCYYHLEEFSKALRDYEKAITLFGENAELWYAKAGAEYNLGKLETSVESYKKVLELNPDNFSAILDIANTMIELGNYDEAEIYLQEIVSKRKLWCEPYFSLAKLNMLKGEIEQGLINLELGFLCSPEERFSYDFEKDWEKILKFLISRE